MATLKLRAIIEIRGLNPYIAVSIEHAATLKANWRKPMPVLIRVDGYPSKPWHINMMPTGKGDFYLYLHGAVRKAADVHVGDTVTVEVDFDSAYQNGPQHPMVEELAIALGQDAAAKTNWDTLPPSRQKEVLRYFAGLKSGDAIARNVDRAMKVLSGEPGHFMGRDWRKGL
jgi:hypothetical protein